MTYTSDRRKFALALLCVTQFVVVLDVAIVNVALPSMPVALTDGFVNAFRAGAGIAFAGVLVSVFMVRRSDLQPADTTVGAAMEVPEAAWEGVRIPRA
jgi:hypothetical protein